MNFLHLGLIKTTIVLATFLVIAFCFENIYVRKISNRRKRLQTKVTMRNLLIIASIIFLAKIWVEGFGHFLALIGFISAALTITQKENILNLSGWLIIMWRNSFSEGDFIRIGSHCGVVKSLGVFYFTLEEIRGNNYSEPTGKTIKIPNAYISTYPIITYEIENFVLIEEIMYISFNSPIEKVYSFKFELEIKYKKYLQSLEKRFTNDEKKEYQKTIKKNKNKNPVVGITSSQDKIFGYKISVRCYSLLHDQIEARDHLQALIINLKKNYQDVNFSTSSL